MNGANPVTLDFLRHVYGNQPGWLTLFAQDKGNQHLIVEWADNVGDLADQAATLEPYCCVWFGVATRKDRLRKGRGGAADCADLPGLWVDIDIAGPNHKDSERLPPTIDAALGLLAAFELPPTVTVHTGGGLQAFWLFHQLEPIDGVMGVAETAGRWGRAWLDYAAGAGYHVDSVFNVDRVMRLPGTNNRKNNGATPVTIVEVDWQRRYTPEQIEKHLSTVLSDSEAQAGPERPAMPIYEGPERPGDAYNRQTDAATILLGLGWTFEHADSNGDRHYTRPGKDPREGASATVYADGHVTIWSDTVAQQYAGLDVRQGYDAFGLFTRLLHGGDHRAASDALAKAGYGTKHDNDHDIFALDEKGNNALVHMGGLSGGSRNGDRLALAPEEDRDDLPKPIEWGAFWDNDRVDAEWLCEPFLARGRSHVLYAPAKAGKSLFVLGVCAGIATGRPVLYRPEGDPLDVIYIDYEMTEGDVQERLVDFGYGPEDDLSRLHYYLIPTMPTLDTFEGGAMLAKLAERDNASLVVLDTTSRAVGGEENDADTIRRLYAHTGSRLKQKGITVVRLDHAGKDAEKGQRGTSAKNDDVDIVWRLTLADDGVLLKATHRRVNWVPPEVKLTVEDDPLRHHLGPRQYSGDTAAVTVLLDKLGLPLDVSVTKACLALREAGTPKGKMVVAEALRWRRYGLDVKPGRDRMNRLAGLPVVPDEL